MEKLGCPELQGLDHALLVTKPGQEPKSPELSIPSLLLTTPYPLPAISTLGMLCGYDTTVIVITIRIAALEYELRATL